MMAAMKTRMEAMRSGSASSSPASTTTGKSMMPAHKAKTTLASAAGIAAPGGPGTGAGAASAGGQMDPQMVKAMMKLLKSQPQ